MSRFRQEYRELRPVEVEPEELLSLTAAAEMLGLSVSALADLMYRGVLRRVVDGEEPNPTRANRVYRSDVVAELKRRRVRLAAGDKRFRGRVVVS